MARRLWHRDLQPVPSSFIRVAWCSFVANRFAYGSMDAIGADRNWATNVHELTRRRPALEVWRVNGLATFASQAPVEAIVFHSCRLVFLRG